MPLTTSNGVRGLDSFDRSVAGESLTDEDDEFDAVEWSSKMGSRVCVPGVCRMMGTGTILSKSRSKPNWANMLPAERIAAGDEAVGE